MQRNSVVLPQPDGPSRHTSSPAAMSRETSLSAVKAPKRLWMLRTFICAPGVALFMARPHQRDGAMLGRLCDGSVAFRQKLAIVV
ncbi:hypothetical protein D3C81_1972400 [compost metagenome]